ncbi:MAG TPA: single-stranded-DNA-specific exonuclease RecJ [Gemmatimonadaceae bacterium]|nr:single-stranded-DNA-specific exonuclease RecJ [Gemmatimonadaceae bacterium]
MTATAIRPQARWLLPAPPDAAAVATLRTELALPDLVCRLLVARGFADPERAKRYLRPRLDHLHAPTSLSDVDLAVERIVRAIRERQRILIHGDYDVDGICSTTILTRTINRLGGKATPFIPHRRDGYDLTAAGVKAARELGAQLVITCDCGTSAHGPIADLRSSGVDVIVTDHHLPGGPLPEAYCVLNPRKPGCPSLDKDSCAAGVAFKLAMAVTTAMAENPNPVYNMLDLVALATIADVAPLRGENRVLTIYGLRLLNETKNVGLRALIRAAGLDRRHITAGRVAFILAPRLNAAGRVGSAMRGVDLLLAGDEATANPIARELEELNGHRQLLDREVLDQAREMVRQMDLDETYGIVLAAEGWHAGVIGIVASRIVEEFGRPTILIALEGDEGKGSGRSISPFDLHAGISQCRDLLLRFGGHRLAAGVSISRGLVPEFAARFNAVARATLTPADLVPELRADLEVGLHEVTDDLEVLLRYVEPCGIGNPSPVLVARGVRVAAKAKTVGKDGLRLLLHQNGTQLTALGWGMSNRVPEVVEGAEIDVAFRIERDEWNGESRLQLRLADFRP